MLVVVYVQCGMYLNSNVNMCWARNVSGGAAYIKYIYIIYIYCILKNQSRYQIRFTKLIIYNESPSSEEFSPGLYLCLSVLVRLTLSLSVSVRTTFCNVYFCDSTSIAQYIGTSIYSTMYMAFPPSISFYVALSRYTVYSIQLRWTSKINFVSPTRCLYMS